MQKVQAQSSLSPLKVQFLFLHNLCWISRFTSFRPKIYWFSSTLYIRNGEKKILKKRIVRIFLIKFRDFTAQLPLNSHYLSTYQSRVYGKAVDATNLFLGLKGFYFLLHLIILVFFEVIFLYLSWFIIINLLVFNIWCKYFLN